MVPGFALKVDPSKKSSMNRNQIKAIPPGYKEVMPGFIVKVDPNSKNFGFNVKTDPNSKYFDHNQHDVPLLDGN